MPDYPISEVDARLMVLTGFAKQVDDTTVQLTDDGVQWTLEYIRGLDPGASPRDLAKEDGTDG